VFASHAAKAEITLSQLVVELLPTSKARDVEIYNDADEPAYVVVEPRRIVNPGQATETSESPVDPERLGLLVSPRKLILEPHQRRLIRIADIRSSDINERVYRITVKPQVGDVTSYKSGLKLMVGYDMLIIARPASSSSPKLVAERKDGALIIKNEGNSSVELDGGEQCRAAKIDCRNLGSKRLYSGASWKVSLPYSTPAKFNVRGSAGWTSTVF
jgi:P pilus assembly chaperone PapD